MSESTKEEMKECLRLMRQGLPHRIDATEAILQLILASDKGPEVDEEFVEKWAAKLGWGWGDFSFIKEMLREAGVQVKEEGR